MGNSPSTEDKFQTLTVTREKLHQTFRRLAKERTPSVDLLTISRGIFGEVRGLDETVSLEHLKDKTGVNDDNIWKLYKSLSKWPCLRDLNQEDYNYFTLGEIVILTFLLNGGFRKLGLDGNYFTKLVFILAAHVKGENKCQAEKQSMEIEQADDTKNEEVEVIVQDGVIKWELLPIVQSFDQVEAGIMDRHTLEELIKACLSMSVMRYIDNAFDIDYKHQISSLVHTIYSEGLTLQQFENNVVDFTPNLLIPLTNLFGKLLLPDDPSLHTDGKNLSIPLLAQLSTVTNIEKMLKSKALYQGSRDGFSINSILTHTSNYNAETVLLITGKIADKGKGLFYKYFPRFHPVVEAEPVVGKRFQMAIILNAPWRVSNTKNFCDDLTVVQLSPRQMTLKSKEACFYFSNIGLGLGVGSPPPLKSKHGGKITFRLRGISLTIDNSLEVGNWRVEDVSDSMFGSTSGAPSIYGDWWFKIREVEVLGLGDNETFSEQKRRLEWEEKEAERRQGLNDYKEGRALLELAGIVGQGGSGGSV